MYYVWICVLTAFSVFLILLERSFASVRLPELKRQARGGKIEANRAYKIRAEFGTQLWLLLWLGIGLSTATTVLLLDRLFWSWVAVLLAAVLLILLRLVIPHVKKPHISLGLASKCAPALEKILPLTRPILRHPARYVERLTTMDIFSPVHSREELVELLRVSASNASLDQNQLKVAIGALTYSEKKIYEIMTPLSVVHRLHADTVLSPVELGELHDSGFSRFPVESSPGVFAGTLFLRDLVESRAEKKVKDVMRPGAYFVHEQFSVDQALQAFLRTHHHQFLVVNDFEEIIGIISIEDVLEQIIGSEIIDEFDAYDDMRAVAEQRAKEIRGNREETVVE